MTYKMSDEMFNRHLALGEANSQFVQEQEAAIESADVMSVEQVLHKQFAKLRKSSKELKTLKSKSRKLAKSRFRMDKQMVEAERRHQRKLKQAKRDAYLWSSLAE